MFDYVENKLRALSYVCFGLGCIALVACFIVGCVKASDVYYDGGKIFFTWLIGGIAAFVSCLIQSWLWYAVGETLELARSVKNEQDAYRKSDLLSGSFSLDQVREEIREKQRQNGITRE